MFYFYHLFYLEKHKPVNYILYWYWYLNIGFVFSLSFHCLITSFYDVISCRFRFCYSTTSLAVPFTTVKMSGALTNFCPLSFESEPLNLNKKCPTFSPSWFIPTLAASWPKAYAPHPHWTTELYQNQSHYWCHYFPSSKAKSRILKLARY